MIAAVLILVAATIALAALWLAPRQSAPRVIFEVEADSPCPFGYRMSWLAIRSRDVARVVAALDLVNPTPANWRTGIGVVYDRRLSERRVFVSPPVNGWIFVVGLALPHPMGRGFVDKCVPLLERLGAEFAEVQYFLTYPAIDYHAWARVIDGKLTRAFAISDEGVILDRGRPTREERSLGLRLFELRGVRERRGDAGGELILYPTEEHVMRLAGRWSLDPTTLDRQHAEPGIGIAAGVPAAWTAERVRKSA